MGHPSNTRVRPADQPALLVVGAGAAGTGLARALCLAGWPVAAVVCREAVRATRRRDLVGAGQALSLDALLAGEPAGGAGPLLLVVSVTDGQLGRVAEQLARRAWPAHSLALHLSGSLPVETLSPLRARGLALGGCHPLKSFVDPEQDAASMAGTVFAVEGDPPALDLAERLARSLGGRAFRLSPGQRPAWHAAATHAANHLVALLDQCLDLATRAGLERDQARAALLPLMRGTLANLEQHTPGTALTGPVVRGEVAVVAAHLAALAQASPDLRATYRALASRALQLAQDERDLQPESAQALKRLLQSSDDTPAGHSTDGGVR